MGTVLLLTVGTTVEPLMNAIEEQRGRDPDVKVFLLYGRAFPGQDLSPFDVARQVKDRARELGVYAEPQEVPDPEDIDICLQAAREVVRRAADADRVLVDFTGGTKPMSAAMVYAALTEPLSGHLVLEYTGGQARDAAGRVLREAMIVRRSERTATEMTIRQVLDRVGRYEYREALALVPRLPDRGRAGFLRKAVDALYRWDEFDYEASVDILRRLHEAARALQEDPDVGGVARLVLRLLGPGNRLVDLVRALRELQHGTPRTWPASDHTPLVTADTLENAERRLVEGRPTDCVLRAYRAVESAVQARLLALRFNPWCPDWQALDSAHRRAYESALEGRSLPRDLALGEGLKLVEILTGDALSSDLCDRLRDLQRVRNQSYLEHGYLRVRELDARRVLGHSAELCARLLDGSLEAFRREVTHTR
jgi:CRISPR-associated protein (TIGR02710 family)